MDIADAVPTARVTTDVIHVDQLTFTYPKAMKPAVQGMDFAVGRGEIFGFWVLAVPASPRRRRS